MQVNNMALQFCQGLLGDLAAAPYKLTLFSLVILPLGLLALYLFNTRSVWKVLLVCSMPQALS